MPDERRTDRGPHVDAEGVWCEVAEAARAGTFAGRPALFLDRDGVIVEEIAYLHRPEDVQVIAGAGEVIAAANRAGIPVVVVTNQSGIGRGYYGWREFAATQARIAGELAAFDAAWDMVVACPYHRHARPPYDRDDHPDRKPNPGMLRRAERRLGVALARSWIVGDRWLDMAAGRAAGAAGGLHVATGYGGDVEERHKAAAQAAESFAVDTGNSIADALDLVDRLRA
jgi:D-glycero-D-manno-heptose 1,7-bisphosphate phosphatase